MSGSNPLAHGAAVGSADRADAARRHPARRSVRRFAGIAREFGDVFRSLSRVFHHGLGRHKPLFGNLADVPLELRRPFGRGDDCIVDVACIRFIRHEEIVASALSRRPASRLAGVTDALRVGIGGQWMSGRATV